MAEKYFGPVRHEKECVYICEENYYNGVTVSSEPTFYDQAEFRMTQPNTFSSSFKTCIIYGKNITHY